jgi:hypothetical protein
MAVHIRGFRLALLVVGGSSAALALTAVFNSFAAGSVPKWSASETALIAGLGAFGAAIFAVEFVRIAFAATTGWSDKKHVVVTAVIFLCLFTIQYTGMRMAIEAHTS